MQSRALRGDPFYKLDDASGTLPHSCELVAIGEATCMGTVSQFGVRENQLRALAIIVQPLYMVGDGNEVLYALRYQ